MAERFTSIRYPLRYRRGLGRLAVEENYAEHVEQLMKQVLFTNPGERVNRPGFWLRHPAHGLCAQQRCLRESGPGHCVPGSR